MNLTKVSTLNYDKKDCNLMPCPTCQSSNFSVFTITQKDTGQEHLHVRCIVCDLTYCPEVKPPQ